MQNRKKQDLSIKFNKIADDFFEFICEEFPEESDIFHKKIQENVKDLLDIEKPRIMVYGIYNSGKSTLINALCKKEVAETADRPMTSQISEYDRGDYTLVDSPGVDAPIEHEQVTEEYLNKCHIILYVISTKGLFEDRDNYLRLAQLIKKDIPFIIVLNDRGVPIDKKLPEEEKKRVKFEHDQDLKLIQYKVIKNLIQVSQDNNIADKYEVVVLNAKKAMTGVLRDKLQLYDASNVSFLEKRISQILYNDESIKALFIQPITNLKEYINEIEKNITEEMSDNFSEDFSLRMNIMASKKDNIMQQLRILTKQAVYSHLEELTTSYLHGDSDNYETVANLIFTEVNECYSAKLNELLVYVNKNFSALHLYIDTMSDLSFDSSEIKSHLVLTENDSIQKETISRPSTSASEKTNFLDFLKSRKKREREKRERLEREAEYKNQQIQYEIQEKMRKKQEARQYASSDLDELWRIFTTIVQRELNEKYHGLIEQIQEKECMNQQKLEDGQRKMMKVKEIRDNLIMAENTID